MKKSISLVIRFIVAALAAASLETAWSAPEAADLAELRKGPTPSGSDAVMSPRNAMPQIARRGSGIRRLCDDRVPDRSAFDARRGAGTLVPLSSYEDDPFVADSIVECLRSSEVTRIQGRRFFLSNDRVTIEEEPVIYRLNASGDFAAFANNPWPQPFSNADGTFLYPNEARFPLLAVERDANGGPVLGPDGLQIWKPLDIHRGMNAAFDAANAVKDAAELWSGRELRWGPDGGTQLSMNTHAFIDFNAFFSPSAKALFFGVVPYRLPGESGIGSIKIFETASSWEIAAHESGHAVHAVLKPNRDFSDDGFRTWGESFGDQIGMWTALRDPSRVESLLTETNDLSRSNPLSAMGEVFAVLVGQGTGLRDAVNEFRVSNTSPEVHDRSEVFTGALYKVFLQVFQAIRDEAPRALMKAGEVMGILLTRASDYTPENTVTLEDAAKAYLKVDKEFFGGQLYTMLVDEFMRREIFDGNSVNAWHAHEAAIPNLRLRGKSKEREIDAVVQSNLDQLGIGPDLGLSLQSVMRDERFGQTIVRVQLTLGRGPGASPLGNHGILTFRANGTLADYHAPVLREPATSDPGVQTQVLVLLEQARQLGLDRHGVPLSIVRKPDGRLTVVARVVRGSGKNTYAEVFSLEKPYGERREIITPVAHRSKAAAVADIVE